MNGEVNLRQWLLLLYGADSIVDLGAANILGTRRTGAVGIHVESGGEGHEYTKWRETEMTELERLGRMIAVSIQVVEGVGGCKKRGSWDFWCWVSKPATSEVVLQNSEKSRQSLVRHES